MKIFEWVGAGVLVLLLVLAVLFLRRAMISRRGTIEMSLRLSTMVAGRGWSSGLGSFVGAELRWYRMFSFSVRPRRVLTRRGLAVESQRAPDGPERIVLPADWVVLRCTSSQSPIEIAMAQSTVTGFLSWLEAAPPGAVSPYLAAR